MPGIQGFSFSLKLGVFSVLLSVKQKFGDKDLDSGSDSSSSESEDDDARVGFMIYVVCLVSTCQ